MSKFKVGDKVIWTEPRDESSPYIGEVTGESDISGYIRITYTSWKDKVPHEGPFTVDDYAGDDRLRLLTPLEDLL